VEFDSPSEYCRGALPDAALAVFPPARAGGSGPPLLGFLVPTALCSRCPYLLRPAEPDAGGEGCRPLTRSALGLSQPLGGLSRVASNGPEFPRNRPRRRSPWNFAALFHAATPLGFALQSLPLSKSRTALRRPSCSLAGSTSTVTGATSRVRRDRFPPSAADRAVRQTREGPRHDEVTGTGLPATAETDRVRTRVAP
jgi:hypothetical protein